MKLKIMVDRKAKKVVFAEAGKEFADFIFEILTMPLATVVKLLKDTGMNGCLASVYRSVESLNAQYFEPNLNKDSVLRSKAGVSVPLLSLHEDAAITHMSHKQGVCRSKVRSNKRFTDVLSCKTSIPSNPGFVKAAVAYMVMDDLEVKPMSISLIKDHVKDFDYLEEKMVEFGVKEALGILKASLETNTVLTTVFLGKDN